MGNNFNLPGPLARFGNAMNLINTFTQFMQNPMRAMLGSGINLPNNVSADNPNAILNYLRSSGTMNEDQFNQCNQMASAAQNLISMFGGGNNRG